MGVSRIEAQVGDGATFSLETGRIAKQAHGAAIARMGDTMVLATVCAGKPREGVDFFPLSVEYVAKTYAAGKIPGGFFKREGKPSEKEILTARLVDRPLRPMFPEGFKNEIQVIATVVSADEVYDSDVLAITAASCALVLSPIPFSEPIAGVRVGMIDGKLKVFPSLEETDRSTLDLIVAGSENSIVMVEGGSQELKEETMIEAILFAHAEIKKLVAIQKELAARFNVVKDVFVAPTPDAEIRKAVAELVGGKLHDLSFNGDKKTRYGGLDNLLAEVKTTLAEKFPDRGGEIAEAFHDIDRDDMRKTILDTGKRIGGRALDGIRPISIELDILPRAHGSALFTRGETQALAVVTLGTKLDEQRIDNIQGEYNKSYMLHYNFPPYSVGEVKRVGSVGRREIGHGHLAERSLSPVLPGETSFPYTIRIVSEVTESNGSSSMASVCGGSLSLAAAGAPIKSHVAGVAMGLIKEGDRIAILTDILGTEDHLGDMDFKVAGTKDGITAIQMDIKIKGITPELMRDALSRAFTARCSIIDIMTQALPSSRTALSPYAPRIFTLKIDKDKIRDIIGPGGKIIREIQDSTGTSINIEDDGTVQIAGANKKATDKAIQIVKDITCDPEIGGIYDAKVKSVVEFGAFVEFLPGREGLLHISELDHRRVGRVEEVVNLGDTVKVKIVGFDRNGKIRLSRKALIPQPGAPEGEAQPPQA